MYSCAMKFFLTVFLIILSTIVYAQKGFYIKPVIGVGISDIDYGRKYRDAYKPDDVSGLAYKIMIMTGYQFSRWKLETGLGYLSVKNGYNNLIFIDPYTGAMPTTTAYADVRYVSSYLIIPVQVAYSAPINKKFDVQPQLGLSLNYNFNTKASGSEFEMSGKKKLDYETINLKYKTTELVGNAGIMLNYKLTKKMAISAGPSLIYFIANTENMAIYKSTLYCVMLDAGITLKM